MSQPVILKSNRYGINLILDAEIPFDELKKIIIEKFIESEKFFKNAKIAISFEGRNLTPEEEYIIIESIMNHTSIHIVCIADDNAARENYMKAKLEAAEAAAAKEAVYKNSTKKVNLEAQVDPTEDISNIGRFYRGTLRSGQALESETSLIIVGDVNPGAKVVSTGNIVILGALKGTAYAGASGDESCFVAALDMNPMQIKIGSAIGRSADKGILASIRERKHAVMEPQIATVLNGQILLAPITRGALNNL